MFYNSREADEEHFQNFWGLRPPCNFSAGGGGWQPPQPPPVPTRLVHDVVNVEMGIIVFRIVCSKIDDHIVEVLVIDLYVKRNVYFCLPLFKVEDGTSQDFLEILKRTLQNL